MDLSREGVVRVNVVLRVHDTGYEGQDMLEISVTDGVERIDLLRVNGSSGLDEIANDEYRSIGAKIPPSWDAATLTVKSFGNSGSGNEQYDVRSIEWLSSPEVGGTCADLQPPAPDFRRGDLNHDGILDLADVVRTLDYLFQGGAGVECEDAADSNDSGEIDISDPLATLFYLFGEGVNLPEPGPDSCGSDPTPDALDCESGSECP